MNVSTLFPISVKKVSKNINTLLYIKETLIEWTNNRPNLAVSVSMCGVRD